MPVDDSDQNGDDKGEEDVPKDTNYVVGESEDKGAAVVIMVWSLEVTSCWESLSRMVTKGDETKRRNKNKKKEKESKLS